MIFWLNTLAEKKVFGAHHTAPRWQTLRRASHFRQRVMECAQMPGIIQLWKIYHARQKKKEETNRRQRRMKRQDGKAEKRKKAKRK